MQRSISSVLFAYSISCTQGKESTEITVRTVENFDITWGLIRDLKCILTFLVDSDGTTIASYRGRTIRIPRSKT